MFTKTRAIVLNAQKHKENAVILQLYTEEYGRYSHILYGAQSKKNGKRQAFLQPFSSIIIEADIRPRQELYSIKEIKIDHPLTNLLFNPHKNAIALFLSEVLLHILHTNEKDKSLFSFLHYSIRYLDLTEKGVANFHIAFLIKLAHFLGFFPALEEKNQHALYYDLKQVSYSTFKPPHNHYLTRQETNLLLQLTRMSYQNMHRFRFNRQERIELLERILSYYKLHLHEFREIYSIAVLKEVFD